MKHRRTLTYSLLHKLLHTLMDHQTLYFCTFCLPLNCALLFSRVQQVNKHWSKSLGGRGQCQTSYPSQIHAPTRCTCQGHPPAHLSLQMQIYFLCMTMHSQTHFLDWCEQQPVYIWLLVSFFERGTVCKTLLLYASLCFIIIFCAKPLPNLIVVFEKHDDTVTVFLFIYK